MTNTSSEFTDFVRFAVRFAKHYLSCGGPTSRLEDQISATGERFGYRVDVFATPTGVFVTSVDPATNKALTVMARIKDESMDLGKLYRMEQLLVKFRERELPIRDMHEVMGNESYGSAAQPLWQALALAFVIGAAASQIRYQPGHWVWLAGLTTMTVTALSRLLFSYLRPPLVFVSFAESTFAYGLAFLIAALTACPPEALYIGTLVIIVPGITLTTATSELADQNYLSGTVKVAKGLLTLLAMGLPFLMIAESFSLFAPYLNGYSLNEAAPVLEPEFSLPLVASQVALVLAFSLFFRVPTKAIFGSLVCGLLGWYLLRGLSTPTTYVTAVFVAALAVGLSSLSFSYFFRSPSQLFSVPGILALVPGLVALASLQNFSSGAENSGIALAFQAIAIITAIVFGLLTARLPFLILSPTAKKTPAATPPTGGPPLGHWQSE